jgi:tetratricopeptide (TPR) repeat protein
MIMNTMKKNLVKLVTIAVLLGLGASPLFAQDINDEGMTEPYHPALVQFRMGYYYQLQGNHEQAIEEFSLVIEPFPQLDSSYSARGDSYAALGEYTLAIADYDAALELTPSFASVLYMRGRVYAATGEIELANADYANAIQQVPDYALPY